MRHYRDSNRGGAILHTTEGPDFLTIHFQEKAYRYTHASAGKDHVEAMRKLARQGAGLHTYIRQHAPVYEER